MNPVAATLTAIWHLEAARVVGAVARMTHDLALAEDCAQDALASALEHWPREGVPDNPAAWLTTAAKRRALDHLRHQAQAAPKHAELAVEFDVQHAIREADFKDTVDAALDDDIGDDMLALVFTACHPLLAPEARAALTLKVVAGLTVEEIARAYFKPPATIAQRIVRAKRTLAAARVPYEVPRGEALVERLPVVLEVLYLMFNEGYAATAGEDWMRPQLCDEALRLARALAHRLPQSAEVQGIAALMALQASRLAARVDAAGEPVLLKDQDRARWDRTLIHEGLARITVAQALPGPAGPYTLQALLAACHARAPRFADTDWSEIVALYDALMSVMPSPVVALNRAVAVGMAYGAAAGLECLSAIESEPVLRDYPLLPAVKGDLLARLDRIEEARAAFRRAAALAGNARERALLLTRAASGK